MKIVDSWGGVVVVAVSHYTTHDDDHHEMILFSRTMHRIYFKEIAEFQYYGSPLLFLQREIFLQSVSTSYSKAFLLLRSFLKHPVGDFLKTLLWCRVKVFESNDSQGEE